MLRPKVWESEINVKTKELKKPKQGHVMEPNPSRNRAEHDGDDPSV
jgi:hypothetical protein